MSPSSRPSGASPFGPDRYTGGRDLVLFLGSVLVAVTFLLGPQSWGLATASAIRETLLVPFLWLQERAEESKTSRARFVAVEAQRDSAAWAAQALPALRAENDRLRTLLGLGPKLTASWQPAEVMRQTQITDGRTLMVSRGSAMGVRPFDPVVAPEGIVGAILSTDTRTSVVMTWANPEFRISAATEDGGVLGVVAAAERQEGEEPLLELRGVPYRDTVAAGTLVLTTGLGGIYPRGVPIGRVLGVAREQPGWERIYSVRPAANIGVVSHVLILSRQEGAVFTVPDPAPALEEAPAPVDSVRPPRRRRRPRPDTTIVAPAEGPPASTPETP